MFFPCLKKQFQRQCYCSFEGNVFCHLLLWEFFFSLVFSSFTAMVCHGVVFFIFILGVLWASWFCMLKSSSLLESSQLFSLQILLPSSFFFFLIYRYFILLSSSVPLNIMVSIPFYVYSFHFLFVFSVILNILRSAFTFSAHLSKAFLWNWNPRIPPMF